MMDVNRIKCDKCSGRFFEWEMFHDCKTYPMIFCKVCHKHRKSMGFEANENNLFDF